MSNNLKKVKVNSPRAVEHLKAYCSRVETYIGFDMSQTVKVWCDKDYDLVGWKSEQYALGFYRTDKDIDCDIVYKVHCVPWGEFSAFISGL